MKDIKKLSMESRNLYKDKVFNIAQIFPNCITDGNIDFQLLKNELIDFIEEKKERFQLSFPGKRESMLESTKVTSKTLRPLKDKSVNYENTKNIYIEGDNLEVLKILQESYLGKIQCIYIDPPYNTGNDFVYNDKFYSKSEENKFKEGVVDEDNNVLSSYIINNKSNGRFHSDWLKMMYPRLILSRNLLSDEGIIFISIDENEEDNLLKIMKEIYGEDNYVGTFIWVNRTTPNDPKMNFASSHEYILIFAKSIDNIRFVGEEKDLSNYKNPDCDPNGVWITDNPSAASGNPDRDRFPIKNPYTGQIYYPPKGRYWAFAQRRVEEWTKSGKLVFPKENNKNFILKKYASDLKSDTKPIGSIINGILTSAGTKELKELFPDIDNKIFDFPKPSELIYKLFSQINTKEGIFMDFFSGSGTSAQSLFKLNNDDSGNRTFILVQLPEKLKDVRYETICDMAEERIRRAGKKIKEENEILTKDLDVGFRVYKVDTSNMKDVYYTPDSVEQSNLLDMVSNVKEDRTAEDLLTQVILNLGLPLDMHIEEKTIGKNKVYYVEENALVACFDDTIDLEILNEISKVNPLKICLRESSFEKDQDKINFFERLKKLSPDTEVNIL